MPSFASQSTNSNAVMFIGSFTFSLPDPGVGEEKRDGRWQQVGICKFLQILQKVNGMELILSVVQKL